MIKFDNLKDLEKYVKGLTTNILKKEVAEAVKKIIDKYIYENVYQYTPKDYKRTYELWDSLSISDVFTDDRGRSVVQLCFDTNKIKSHIVDGNWNQHADVYGNNTSQYIPLWIEEGTEGSLWDREPANIFGDSAEEINKNKIHIKILMDELRANGFDIKRIK